MMAQKLHSNVVIGIIPAKGIVMSQSKSMFILTQKGSCRALFAFLAVGILSLTMSCDGDDIEDPDSWTTDSSRETNVGGDYNTIAECEAIYHKGDGWKSLCDRHGGWGNPNAPASGMTCKRIDCERNAEHDVSPYFWPAGCYCKDGYRGPDPDEGLDPLPPGCKDAMAGRDTFCQKHEECRGAGTRTLKNYSCRDVNRGFGPLVCSGMFSDNDWKKMRAVCCFDPNDDGSGNDGDQDNGDSCPADPAKTEPGVCGCGTPDIDSDGDRALDCQDSCPHDPNKTEKGTCGCGTPDNDSDGDGTEDCNDRCPLDPDKTHRGYCGCGNPDSDSDGDGTVDCRDECPSDPNKTKKGTCGCGKREGTCNTCVDQLTYCPRFINFCDRAAFQEYCCATCKGR